LSGPVFGREVCVLQERGDCVLQDRGDCGLRSWWRVWLVPVRGPWTSGRGFESGKPHEVGRYPALPKIDPRGPFRVCACACVRACVSRRPVSRIVKCFFFAHCTLPAFYS